MADGKHFMLERVQIGLEITPGTAVVTTLEVPFVAPGLVPSDVGHMGEIRGSAHFPSRTDMVALGHTHSFTLAWELNRDNIMDFLLLGMKRTSGLLPSFTLIVDQLGVEPGTYAGCMVESLQIGWSRGGSPGAEAVLTGVMTVQARSFTPNTGTIQSLTAAHQPRFRAQHCVITVGGSAVTIPLSLSFQIANALALGPPNSSSVRDYLVPGEEQPSISIARHFFNNVLRNLLINQTENTSNSLLLATGTVNETVTLTMGKLKLGTRERGDDGGAPNESVALEPYHTGSAHQIVISKGSATAASTLGLTP